MTLEQLLELIAACGACDRSFTYFAEGVAHFNYNPPNSDKELWAYAANGLS